MPQNGDGASDTAEARLLLVLTHSRPAEALTRARGLLTARPCDIEGISRAPYRLGAGGVMTT